MRSELPEVISEHCTYERLNNMWRLEQKMQSDVIIIVFRLGVLLPVVRRV